MAATPIFPGTAQTWLVQLLPADSTTVKDFFTAGANGAKIDSIGIASTDSANREVSIYINNLTTDFLVGTINVPAASGNANATPAINFLNSTTVPWLAQDGSIILKGTWKLRVQARTAVTAATAISIFAYGGDF